MPQHHVSVLELLGKAVRQPGRILPYVRYRLDGWSAARLFERFRGRPYREFYAAAVDERAVRDPKEAIGGLWEEMGRLQIEFMTRRGMLPRHRLLDVGCGSMRAGRHFVRYLDPGHYVGLDISAAILEAGRRVLREEGLADRGAVLIQNHDLRFAEVAGQSFDWVLAQSVFSHMPLEDIDECLRHVPAVMAPGATFFATFLDGGDRTELSADRMDFYHPLAELQRLARGAGLSATVTEDYPHPRGQRMLALVKAS